jgi:hypothetical protein
MIKMYLQSAGTAEILKRVEELSEKRGVSMAQIAIAWSLAQDGTWSVFNLQDLIGKCLRLLRKLLLT